LLLTSIYIKSYGSISPLGATEKEVWNNYLEKRSLITPTPLLTADLSQKSIGLIETLREENNRYKNLDKSVLIAILASRIAFKNSKWKSTDKIGINIGSSRGATSLFEKYFSDFIEHKKLSALSSPTTTLGNISTWVAQDLQVQGPVISHSITCSTAFSAVLNAIAWLNADMVNKFIVGGTEAANTPFTVAQMQALKIYAKKSENTYPCESLNFKKSDNTMVLGEGAAIFTLDRTYSLNSFRIKAIGYATEQISHNASISDDAYCFQQSMKQALKGFNKSLIDIVVMHAPGTIKGDNSELTALKLIFNQKLPALTSNKWKIGHTLGASGALSLEFALLMLKHQTFIETPFYKNSQPPKDINNILINAVGFGGNAVSIIVGR